MWSCCGRTPAGVLYQPATLFFIVGVCTEVAGATPQACCITVPRAALLFSARVCGAVAGAQSSRIIRADLRFCNEHARIMLIFIEMAMATSISVLVASISMEREREREKGRMRNGELGAKLAEEGGRMRPWLSCVWGTQSSTAPRIVLEGGAPHIGWPGQRLASRPVCARGLRAARMAALYLPSAHPRPAWQDGACPAWRGFSRILNILKE